MIILVSYFNNPYILSFLDITFTDTKITSENPNIYTKTTKITSTEKASNERRKIPLYEMETILPFLEGANKRTILAFHDLLNDPDIPSEGKRQQEVSILKQGCAEIIFRKRNGIRFGKCFLIWRR